MAMASYLKKQAEKCEQIYQITKRYHSSTRFQLFINWSVDLIHLLIINLKTRLLLLPSQKNDRIWYFHK